MSRSQGLATSKMADALGKGSGGSTGAGVQTARGAQCYAWQVSDNTCLDLLGKQFRVQSGPEFVQVTGEEAAAVGDAQVFGTLAAGEGLLVEGSIIGSFEDSPAVEGLRTVGAADFTEELVQSMVGLEGAPTNTILYLQPDGTLVEGGGDDHLRAEEQYRLVEQLVEVPEQGGVRMMEEGPPPHFVQHAALAPEALQQVIEQVTKSHELQQSRDKRAESAELLENRGPAPRSASASAAAPPQPVAVVQNAAQQLQNVAQQVALEQNKFNSATRLLQYKLEAIQIQVQPKENKEKPMPPLAAIQPQTVKLNQPLNGNSSASRLNILGSPIFRLQPVAGSGQQQFLLHSSSDPSIQLLVQRPLPPLGPVSKKKITMGKVLNGQKTYPLISATNSENITTVPSKPLTSGSEQNPKDKLKLRKSLKIKTRSGRISRPPKYKARDYKFIKTEDLVDGRLSDSDDYSELSVEEDDEGKKQNDALFSPLSYNLKPKTFKCETCEKSYIGRGGLARHYKLNPGHGKVDSLPQKTVLGSKRNGLVFPGEVDGADGGIVRLTLPDLSVMAVLKNESVSSSPALEDMGSKNNQETSKLADKRLLEPVQQTETSGWSSETPKGHEQVRGTKCGRPTVFGRRRRGRPGRPPKSLNTVSAEHHRLRRKGRLKELLHQCSSEDVMEVALPYLTKLVTVYEFLLMKVENGHPTKAVFPDVYKEFEELHNLVKIMAQDYFNNPGFSSFHQILEVKNPKVAETLGITEKFLRKQKLHEEGYSRAYLLDKQLFSEAEQKCANEGTNEELVPPMKRIRREGTAENATLMYASDNGVEEEILSSCTLPSKGGSSCQLNRTDAVSPCMLRVTSEVELGCIDSKLPQAYGECAEPAGRMDSSELDILLQSPGETVDCSQVASVGLQSQDNLSSTSCQQTEFLANRDNPPEKCVRGHLNEKSQSKLKNCDFFSPVSLQGGDGQSTCLTNGERAHIAASSQVLQHDADIQDSLIPPDHVEQLNDSDIANQMQELERALSANVSPDHLYRTQPDPQLLPIHDAALSTQVSFATQVENLTELSYGIVEQPHGQNELENTITVDGTVAFEITDDSHPLLTQGHEQIFIQTSDGLILSHPSAAVVSQTEGIVIVTNSDGTTMHIRAHEGVPLETVEALLAMEAEGQSEGILVSQSEMEK
ncbi:zinc finger protein 839 isoform X2 [Rhinatrema bivittatum]|uniref:zinc finger protein 839 isoform X2 n=1 Tax=Rhinatrema bivittatum TaxID=194408 RepID=UPI0011289A91|nr:zinc finger protein 839 isoform X2 [Rhinatrema bivittatum]